MISIQAAVCSPISTHLASLLGLSKDELYTIMPLFSILELLVVLLYLGHFSGCFFYLLSTPPYQTAGEKHRRRSAHFAAGIRLRLLHSVGELGMPGGRQCSFCCSQPQHAFRPCATLLKIH
jgi:hypothetical protein